MPLSLFYFLPGAVPFCFARTAAFAGFTHFCCARMALLYCSRPSPDLSLYFHCKLWIGCPHCCWFVYSLLLSSPSVPACALANRFAPLPPFLFVPTHTTTCSAVFAASAYLLRGTTRAGQERASGVPFFSLCARRLCTDGTDGTWRQATGRRGAQSAAILQHACAAFALCIVVFQPCCHGSMHTAALACACCAWHSMA